MAQTMQDINSNLCEAMSIIANRTLEQAKFDKTLKCTIVDILDLDRNQYSCKYQDITFPAYATVNNLLQSGQNVYVLIPDGDMSNEKIILGSYNLEDVKPIVPTIYWRTE